MKSLTAAAMALLLVLGFVVFSASSDGTAAPAFAAGRHPVPEATKKPKPSPTASPSTALPTPTPTRTGRTEAEKEGDRWVQLAVIGGGGLLGCVLVFFGIGALLRRRPRNRRAGG